MTSTRPDSKTRILDAAWALVERRGRADVTMREVAELVGISRQALYLHFPNRATLLLAMVRHFDDTHGDPAGREHRRALPPIEGLEAALRWWLAYLPRVLPVARALEAASMVGADGAHSRVCVATSNRNLRPYSIPYRHSPLACALGAA